METTKFNLLFPLVIMLTPAVPGQVLAQQDEAPDAGGTDLLDMPLEKLLEIEVGSSASLTKTTRRLTPATVTTITQDEIWSSGARYLDELLDIYVPNFQWIRHPWEYNHAGLRGIISDRDHKYLLLVNGRVMNEHTHYGALSERDLPMLRDIHHIDVIRGPGSALYGPGAISMVINLITENALNFQGSEVTGRLGAVEEFYSGEYKYAEKHSDNSGLYIYTGLGDYLGADSSDAPFIWGGSNAIGQPYHNSHLAGDAVYLPTERDNQGFRDLTKVKLFTEYTAGDFDIWARYTRGGGYYAPDLFSSMWNYGLDSYSTGYQQATIYASNKYEISETLGIDYTLSYDMFDFERLSEGGNTSCAHREDEYYGKLMARWNPNDSHSVAVGGEWSHEEFGFESPGHPAGDEAVHPAWAQPNDLLPFYNPTGALPRWDTDLYSLLAEYQWNMSDTWTSFIGGRLDWHTLTPKMFSPRAVLIYTPNEKDTVKASFTRSVRVPQSAEIYKEFYQNNSKTDPEKINVWELRYERQQTENLWLAGSLFYQDQDIVGAASGVLPVGNLRTWGFELEATYKTERAKFTASHGFTTVYDFSDTLNSDYPPTMADRGYRRELVAWSRDVTKLTGRYKLTDQLDIDGSLRIYWKFYGQEDYATSIGDYWANDVGWNGWCYDTEHDDTFGMSAFLNLGLQYKPTEDLTIRVDGYNLLGMFDIDLNKRLLAYDGLYPADARASAPALGVSPKYKF